MSWCFLDLLKRSKKHQDAAVILPSDRRPKNGMLARGGAARSQSSVRRPRLTQNFGAKKTHNTRIMHVVFTTHSTLSTLSTFVALSTTLLTPHPSNRSQQSLSPTMAKKISETDRYQEVTSKEESTAPPSKQALSDDSSAEGEERPMPSLKGKDCDDDDSCFHVSP